MRQHPASSNSNGSIQRLQTATQSWRTKDDPGYQKLASGRCQPLGKGKSPEASTSPWPVSEEVRWVNVGVFNDESLLKSGFSEPYERNEIRKALIRDRSDDFPILFLRYNVVPTERIPQVSSIGCGRAVRCQSVGMVSSNFSRVLTARSAGKGHVRRRFLELSVNNTNGVLPVDRGPCLFQAGQALSIRRRCELVRYHPGQRRRCCEVP